MTQTRITKFLLKRVFKLQDDYLVPFGPKGQNGSLMATVYTKPIWEKLSKKQKLLAIIKLRWTPNSETMIEEAKKILMSDVFGTEADYGDVLYDLNLWHHHRTWLFDNLKEEDKAKLEAIQGSRLLTGLRHRANGTNDLLHLNMAAYFPEICFLATPMIIKIPVISLRYSLEIQENFAFNSIREAEHPQSDELISYLYETLLIQQKIAVAFHQFFVLLIAIREKDDDSKLTMEELDALTLCDNIINYLKSTVEKIGVILALTFEITNLETYKKHSQKIKALEAKLPPKAIEASYFHFIWENIQPAKLEILNNLRTGINHKKGISKLQPHSYLDKEVKGLPLFEMYDTLFEQHRTNTAIFIASLALLTDDLVFRKPPNLNEIDFPFPYKTQ